MSKNYKVTLEISTRPGFDIQGVGEKIAFIVGNQVIGIYGVENVSVTNLDGTLPEELIPKQAIVIQVADIEYAKRAIRPLKDANLDWSIRYHANGCDIEVPEDQLKQARMLMDSDDLLK